MTTPMTRGRGSRTKGGRGEAEAIHLLRDIGFDARRNFGSGSAGGSDVIGVPDHAIEIKRCETVKVWQWISQCEAASHPTETAVVVFRRSRSPWYAVLDAGSYFAMVKELQELRGAA